MSDPAPEGKNRRKPEPMTFGAVVLTCATAVTSGIANHRGIEDLSSSVTKMREELAEIRGANYQARLAELQSRLGLVERTLAEHGVRLEKERGK